MKNRLIDIPLVALATYTLLLFTSISAFRLTNENGAYSLEKFAQLPNNTNNYTHKWLVNAVLPSYLREFMRISPLQESTSSLELNQNEAIRQYLDNLLYGVSDSCKVHVTEWYWRWAPTNLANIGTQENEWVLQIVDAWGKVPEGILSGHVTSYGDFDECVQIKVEDLKILNNIYPQENAASSKHFEGQYCTTYLLDYGTAMQLTPHPVPAANSLSTMRDFTIQESVSLEEFIKMLLGPTPATLPLLPSVALCWPNSCSHPEVQQILVNSFRMMYKTFIPEANLAHLPWPVMPMCVDAQKPPLSAGAVAMIALLSTLLILALVAGIIDYWNSMDTNVAVSRKATSSTAYKYLMTFSLYTNIRKWLSTRKTPDDLGCLHGIRSLSTAWVVLAHTFSVFILGPQWNRIDTNHMQKNWTVLAVINGTFSVDTFFVMSGLLATYNILKMLDKTKGKFNIIMFYVHRYVRLTPTYAIFVGIAANLYTYVGNGPQWYFMDIYEGYCKDNWWANILYINNLVNSKEMCNGISWYLANDMQFYILSPFIVYPIWKWKKIGLTLLTVYTIMSCIAPVLVVHYASNTFPAMVLRATMNPTEIYHRPWSRISTFLVGVWLGWALYKTKGSRIRIPRPINMALWLASTGTALAILFAIHPWFDPESKIPKVAGYIYAGLSRFSWGVAIAWVIFACVKGYGGIVNKFLSWKVFMPLGRLSFCVYLFSYHLQTIFHLRLTAPIKWNTYTMVNLFFAHLVMSYLFGFMATLLFESPFMILQKLIFDRVAGADGKQKLTRNDKNVLPVVEMNNSNGQIDNNIEKQK